MVPSHGQKNREDTDLPKGTIFISAQVCGKINCVIASYFIELESFICYLNHNIFHAF